MIYFQWASDRWCEFCKCMDFFITVKINHACDFEWNVLWYDGWKDTIQYSINQIIQIVIEIDQYFKYLSIACGCKTDIQFSKMKIKPFSKCDNG